MVFRTDFKVYSVSTSPPSVQYVWTRKSFPQDEKEKKLTQNPLTRYLFSRRDDIVSVGVNLSGASSVLPKRRLVSHIVHLNTSLPPTTDGWPLTIIITIFKSLVDIAVRVLFVCKQQPKSASTFSFPLWVGMVQLGGHLRYDCLLRASAGLRKRTVVVIVGFMLANMP